MTKKIIFIVIFILQIHSLIANETSPYTFLRNSATARITGLAGAVVSLEDDPGSLFFNPATLITSHNRNMNVTFLKHVLDINSGNISYIHHFADSSLGSLAGSVVFTNYGSFDYIDNKGNPTGGTFTGNLLALQTSYANMIDENFYYGVTGKLIYNSLEHMQGFAAAIDAGLLYKLKDDRSAFGISILNAGTEISSMTNNSYSMPLDIRFGGSHRLRGLPLLFNFNFTHINEVDGNFFSRFKNVAIGGELYFGEWVRVRLGYDSYIRSNVAAEENKGLAGISGGIGVLTDWIMDFDYGLAIYTNDLLVHRFGINFNL